MLSSIVSRRALDLCLVALVPAFIGCASGPDAPVPVPAPQPFAIVGPELVRPEPVGTSVRAPKRAAVRSADKVGASVPTRPPASVVRSPDAGRLPARVRRSAPGQLDSTALEKVVTKRFAYEPLSVALTRRTRKAELADRIAAAVVYEAERNRMSPSLLAAVLLIENAPFDTTAISSQGAIGLMQVMPVHIGSMTSPPSSAL